MERKPEEHNSEENGSKTKNKPQHEIKMASRPHEHKKMQMQIEAVKNCHCEQEMNNYSDEERNEGMTNYLKERYEEKIKVEAEFKNIACELMRLTSEAKKEDSKDKQVLCANVQEEWEKISMMVDSGASETVASIEHFEGYPLVRTTASGTSYSSASADPKEDVVNVGEKFVETVGENGANFLGEVPNVPRPWT